MARVRDVMLDDVPTLGKEAKIGEAARLLAGRGTGCIIVAEGKKPVGIVTELDLIRNIVKGKSLKSPVSGIMTSSVVSMSPSMKLDEALKTIDIKKFRRYPVVDNGELVGLATKRDIVNAISDNVRFHRNIQNAVLVIFVLFEFFVFVLFRYLYKYLPLGS
ncbi:CBS domain-containing protein [Candidatus Woesearchaeota archaeon]|nr:CBS domain-containing protein [Candidatus Woesearchaeota archaeon]